MLLDFKDPVPASNGMLLNYAAYSTTVKAAVDLTGPEFFAVDVETVSVPTPTDTIILLDVLSKVWNIQLSLSDTLTLTDALVKSLGLTKSDSLSLTDALFKTARLSLADSYTITDIDIETYAPGSSTVAILRMLLGVG